MNTENNSEINSTDEYILSLIEKSEEDNQVVETKQKKIRGRPCRPRSEDAGPCRPRSDCLLVGGVATEDAGPKKPDIVNNDANVDVVEDIKRNSVGRPKKFESLTELKQHYKDTKYHQNYYNKVKDIKVSCEHCESEVTKYTLNSHQKSKFCQFVKELKAKASNS